MVHLVHLVLHAVIWYGSMHRAVSGVSRVDRWSFELCFLYDLTTLNVRTTV